MAGRSSGKNSVIFDSGWSSVFCRSLPGIAWIQLVLVAEHRGAERASEVVPVEGLEVDDLAQHLVADERAQRLGRRLEVVAVADADLLARPLGVLDERLGVGVAQRQRFLDEHVRAGVDHLLRELQVHLGRRGDVHHVRSLPGEHRVEVVVHAGDAPADGELLGHLHLAVAHGHELCDGLELADLLDVAVRDLAAPDDGDLQLHRSSRARSRPCAGGSRRPWPPTTRTASSRCAPCGDRVRGAPRRSPR